MKIIYQKMACATYAPLSIILLIVVYEYIDVSSANVYDIVNTFGNTVLTRCLATLYDRYVLRQCVAYCPSSYIDSCVCLS